MKYARNAETGELERPDPLEMSGLLPGLVAEEYTLQKARRIARRQLDAEERPPVTFPEALTLAERLAQPPDPVAWRVEGWLPAGGRAVLAAQAKAGKTHVAANLVRCLVDGQPWLGRDRVAPVVGTVAVVDFEMTERQLYEWYRDLGIVATDRVLVFGLRGRAATFDLRDEGLRRQWSQLLREHGVEFVVWDCLRPVVDALGLDENHDASALLTAFDTMLLDAGRPEALVVHHMGHSNEHGPRWLSANGRDVAQAEIQVERDAVTRRLTATGGSRAAVRMTAACNAVVAVLAEAEGPLTKGAIEAALMAGGVPRAAGREALAALVAIRQILIEPGERNATLHRLNPDLEPSSSPVRRSSPESASKVASQFAAAPIGRRAGEVEASQGQESVRRGELDGLTDAQRAILDRIQAESA